MKTYSPSADEAMQSREWWVVDATGETLGRLASRIARVLRGKHKPTFTPHLDTGDFVVVLNADKVVFTRNKWSDKLYRDHTGYVSGLKTKTAKEMLERNREEILRRAVWGMTNKSSLARHQMKKLKIYVGEEHPHKAQNPQPLPKGTIRRTVLETSSKEVKKA